MQKEISAGELLRRDSSLKGNLLVVEYFACLVFDATDGVLHLALSLVSLSLGFGLGVARHLTGGFFDRPFACFAAPSTRSLSMGTLLCYAQIQRRENAKVSSIFLYRSAPAGNGTLSR